MVLLNYNVTKFQPSAYQISAAEFQSILKHSCQNESCD